MEKEKIYEILNNHYFSVNMDEKEILDIMPIMVKKVRTFVDIGASLGQFTCFANRAMTNCEIIAIEADPLRHEELERNCIKWSESGNCNHIRVIHAAISDCDGEVIFNTTNSNVSGGLITHDTSGARTNGQPIQWETVSVQSLTIDTLFPSAPDFIKMDIEGAELQALRGAKKVLDQGVTTWLIELHDWGNPEQVLDLMHNHGYKMYDYYGRKIFSRSLMMKNPNLWASIYFHSTRTQLWSTMKKLLR